MILVVAFGQDKHAHAVVDALRREGCDVCWIDLASLTRSLRLTLCPGDTAGTTLETEHGRSVALDSVRTIWWRRPALPEASADLDDVTRQYVASEWEHFIDSIEPCVDARWVNPPRASRAAGRKARQLVEARAVGLRVPRTVMTNDPDAVRRLAAEGIDLIYKRLGAAPRPISATKPLLASDLERLEVLQLCPAIFQERIHARADIRVTAIGDELWAAEIDTPAGGSPLDFRFDMGVAMCAHELPSDVAEQVLSLLTRLGLVHAAIDLRLTDDGEYVFLEVNPAGQYLFVELLAGLPLTERMVRFLARDDPVDSRALTAAGPAGCLLP